jgi:hypothetical protein
MIELEVCAAGLRDLNKILELDESTIIFRETRGIFIKLGFERRFAGALPPEWRPRSKASSLLA